MNNKNDCGTRFDSFLSLKNCHQLITDNLNFYFLLKRNVQWTTFNSTWGEFLLLYSTKRFWIDKGFKIGGYSKPKTYFCKKQMVIIRLRLELTDNLAATEVFSMFKTCCPLERQAASWLSLKTNVPHHKQVLNLYMYYKENLLFIWPLD